MRYKAIFLLPVLTSYPTWGGVVAAVVAGQEPSNIATSTIAAGPKLDLQFTTTVSPSGTEPSLVVLVPSLTQRRQQHIVVAARTASPITTSIAILPIPSPSDDNDGDETSDGSTAENSSTITMTITRNRTTTIRPTVTVTSLFSSVGPTTSGASGRQGAPWGSISG